MRLEAGRRGWREKKKKSEFDTDSLFAPLPITPPFFCVPAVFFFSPPLFSAWRWCVSFSRGTTEKNIADLLTNRRMAELSIISLSVGAVLSQ